MGIILRSWIHFEDLIREREREMEMDGRMDGWMDGQMGEGGKGGRGFGPVPMDVDVRDIL